MIRKVITTLGIVLLAIGMFSCDSPSGPVFAAVESQKALVEGTDTTSYTVTLDKAVALVAGVTDLSDKVTLTHTLADGNAATPPSPAVTTATIDETDAKMINLVFAKTTFAVGDKLKIDIAEGAIEDTTSAATQNSDISVTVTVGSATASGPVFAATQPPLNQGGFTSYAVSLDKEVELVASVDLKTQITLTHIEGGNSSDFAVVSATIENKTKIRLEFANRSFFNSHILKIKIAANAIQTVTGKYKNAEISVEVVVVQ